MNECINVWLRRPCHWELWLLWVCADLADASGPVPDEVVPVPVAVRALVHDLGDQVVHGQAEHREGPQLVGEGLLLVRRRPAVLLNGRTVVHLIGYTMGRRGRGFSASKTLTPHSPSAARLVQGVSLVSAFWRTSFEYIINLI